MLRDGDRAADIYATASRVVVGERKAIGRAISIVESGEVSARALLRTLAPHLGHALVVGVTGPPGAGKSTLVGLLISKLLEQYVTVGALLVDPSSPRTKGAILGDRMRFARGSMRGALFTRSLASRGHLGGLTDTLSAVIDVLDAAKFPVVIVEAVGGGQADVEINDLADLTLVLSPPGLGDDVQAIKAGVLEIADFIVVTKCDRPGAEAARQQLALMVSHSSVPGESRKVLAVSSTTGEGVGELMDEIVSRLRPSRCEVRCVGGVRSYRSGAESPSWRRAVCGSRRLIRRIPMARSYARAGRRGARN